MSSRREIKKRARGILRRHYLLLIVLCLIASAIGLEYTGTLSVLGIRNGSVAANVVASGTTTANGFTGVWRVLAEGDEDDGANLADIYIAEKQAQAERKLGSWKLGRTRGVLASAVNEVTSGSVLVRIYVAIQNVVGAGDVATAIFVVLSLLLYLAFQALVVNVYGVISRRLLLEARIYERVPIQRALFLLRAKKWMQTVWTVLLTNLWEFLWWMTIVGGVIKHYSYRMVPYIIAENPGLKTREAVGLSQRMMDGHKWECFKLELSFFFWELLSLLTVGVVGVFFVNPYQSAVIAEYYAELRRQAKEQQIPGAEWLCDTYLYEKADVATIQAAYSDIPEPVELPKLTGVRGFFANVFGVVLQVSPEEAAYEKALEQDAKYEREKAILDRRTYPDRLNPLYGGPRRRSRRSELHYMRHYSVWSLMLMFFAFSMVGWFWEVMLHLVETGEFVNRGMLHGPWLPIYGTGCVLILLVLYRFRSRPLLEFTLAMVLCGVVEYFTSFLMEITHGGMKWWDYSGYFLNLNGRICAEGLLAFGLGGIVMVYLLAPLADDFCRRFPIRRIVAVACVLACLFCTDQIYSLRAPNTGRGITDTAGAISVEMNGE